jgi:16S rRNA (guanine527-N7)-methyltransferase
LKALLLEAGQPLLSSQQLDYFSAYLSLIIRWNARMNLTSIRTEDGILARHFVESIACARAIPDGVRTLLDYGSGAGFPGIPIAICRPEITVTLAESQGKKAAFLQEVVRSLQLSASVHHGRADAVRAEFDCVTLRAVDKIDVWSPEMAYLH